MLDNVSTQTLVIGLACSLIVGIGGFAGLYLIIRKNRKGPRLNYNPTTELLHELRMFLEQERPKKVRYQEGRGRYLLSFSKGRYVVAESESPAFTPPCTEGSIIACIGGDALYLGFSDEKYDGSGVAEAAGEAKRIYGIVWGFVGASRQAA